MAVIPAQAMPTATGGKTRAKQRYLRRKKERRKQRKVAAPRPKVSSSVKPVTSVSDPEDNDEEGGGWEDENMAEDGPGQAPSTQGKEDTMDGVEEDLEDEEKERARRKAEKKKKREERPKKRRKVEAEDVPAEAPSSPPPAHPSEPTSNLLETEAILDNVDHLSSLEPPAFLPSFPLPTQPAPPSKLALALQGLDTALEDATVIDASSTLPLSPAEDAQAAGISEKMRRRLLELGISELFAVQTALLPFLLPSDPLQRALYQPYDPPRDACVSAPTGSGKTLAYAVPIVEILSRRLTTRLRALVVLPTRDLVSQVRETFESLSKGRGLKIGSATGQHSFASEQAQLVPSLPYTTAGGASRVDILVCTPGRLLDHLAGTKNFSLQHLRFLVVDEADRLLAGGFQGWLVQVLAAVRPPSDPIPFYTYGIEPDTSLSVSADMDTNKADGEDEVWGIPIHDALAPAWTSLGVPTDLDEKRHSSCQKLLFSATLTADPAQLSGLGLRDPKYFVVSGPAQDGEGKEVMDVDVDEQVEEVVDAGKKRALGRALEGVALERFVMPAGLREHYVVVDGARKPLVLFWLLRVRGVQRALVFTKSAESTARLVRLLELLSAAVPASPSASPASGTLVAKAFSSDLVPSERRSVLDGFKRGEIDVLVCSDLIARGLDVPDVEAVVSYDAPVDMRKYVHRAGRTARAGREGQSWVLVEEQEARHFKTMMKEAEHLEKVKRVRVQDKELEAWAHAYAGALEKLKEQFGR